MARRDPDKAADAAAWLEFCNSNDFMSDAISTSETVFFRNMPFEERRKILAEVVLNNKKYKTTEHKVVNKDIQNCVYDYADSDMCILNYADFVKPGGLFIEGGWAQEEAVCSFTGLYPILSNHAVRFYLPNEVHKNYGAYTHSFMIMTGVPWVYGDKKGKLSVVSSAAPNFRYAYKQPNNDWLLDMLQQQMLERQELCYLIAATTGVDIFFAGAWGCGIFKNDPNLVAKNWRKCTEKYPGAFAEVVHPIPGENSDNYRTFKRILG